MLTHQSVAINGPPKNAVAGLFPADIKKKGPPKIQAIKANIDAKRMPCIINANSITSGDASLTKFTIKTIITDINIKGNINNGFNRKSNFKAFTRNCTRH